MNPVRRATITDAVELTRLRAVMFADNPYWPARESSDPEWRARSEIAFARRLADEDFTAFVVDHPSGTGLIACAVGEVDRRLPAPGRGESVGHVASVCTDPGFRRRGHARAVMAALLDWFDARDITRIDLNATAAAAPLYRSLGFTDARTSLRRTRAGQATPEPGTGSASATSGSPASE